MIQLSNGYAFEYMAASGALAFNGKGWPWEKPLIHMGIIDPTLFISVTKTITLKKNAGNLHWHSPFRCLRLVNGGVINAIGLSNPGFDWWKRKIGLELDLRKNPLIVSISGKPEELAKMAHGFHRLSLIGIELNASCPNIGLTRDTEEIIDGCKAIKNNSDLPLIIKISVGQDVFKIIEKVEQLIEAIAINSVPWKIAYPQSTYPFKNIKGGAISGKIAQNYNWKLIQKISDFTKIPVIGPSIWNFEDMEKVRKLGAKAVSFGSVFLRYPWRPTLYIKKEQNN